MKPAPATIAGRPVGAALLLAVAATVSFPLWIPHHRNPIPTFYQEWWALALGVAAVLIACWRRRATAIGIPPLAWPVLALAALVLGQWAGGLAQPTLAAFAAGTLLWATALIVLASDRAPLLGRATLADALAWGLLAGALIGALIGVAQWLGAPPIDNLLSAGSPTRIWGNLNQPNHLAAQMLLGIVAATWLRAERRLPEWPALAALGLLVFVGVASASRSFWAGFAGTLLVVHWLARQSACDSPARFIRRDLLAALAIALVCKAGFLFAPDSGEAGSKGLVSAQSDGLRLKLLDTGWQIFAERPLLGAGWGRFARAAFPEDAVAAPMTPAEHAHNIIAQLAAETGLAGLALLGLALVLAWRALRQAPANANARLGLLVLAPLAVYSLVEYPLWYSFFLAPAALALGLLGSPDAGPRAPAVPARLLALLAAAGLVALLVLRHDYGSIERTLRWPLTDPGEAAMPWAEVIPRMTELRRRTAFAPWIDYALARAVPVNGDDPVASLRMIDLAMKSFPSDDLAIKRVLLLAISGEHEAARNAFRALERGFPEQAEANRRLLGSATRDHAGLAQLARALNVATEGKPLPPAIEQKPPGHRSATTP